MNMRPAQAFSSSRPAAPVPVQPRAKCVPHFEDPTVQPVPTAGVRLEALAAAVASLVGQLAGSWPQPALNHPAPAAKPSWRRVPFPLNGRPPGDDGR